MRAGSVSGRGTYAGERSSSLYNDGEGGDNAQGEREPFPNINGCKENTDYTPDAMALNKNIGRHGDQLVYVEETLVAQITEENPDEETTVTQMIAYDADENFTIFTPYVSIATSMRMTPSAFIDSLWQFPVLRIKPVERSP